MKKALKETQTLRAAYQAESVLHLCTKFEADSSFRSKVIMGSQISPRRRPPSWGRRTAKI